MIVIILLKNNYREDRNLYVLGSKNFRNLKHWNIKLKAK